MSIKGAQPFFGDSIESILAEIKTVLETGGLTQGQHLKQFEAAFAKEVGSEYAFGVNSGGTGLELILKAIGVEGKEVIVPTNTFVASASAVHQAGGKAVFCDTHADTLSLDIDKAASLITDQTKAIMMVYMFGIMPPNIDQLVKLCKDRNIYLIEDAAHAHGASYQGTKAGSIGDAACFSFYATKVITTGEGGVITTSNQEIADGITSLRNHGKSLNGPEFDRISNNYRLSEIPAIIGNHQMKLLEQNIQRRNEIAQFYIQELGNMEQLTLLPVYENAVHSFWRFPALLSEDVDRSQLQQILAEKYDFRITWMYEPACHLQPLFKETHQHQEGDFEVAEDSLKRLINLPTHMGISDDDLQTISKALKTELK